MIVIVSEVAATDINLAIQVRRVHGFTKGSVDRKNALLIAIFAVVYGLGGLI